MSSTRLTVAGLLVAFGFSFFAQGAMAAFGKGYGGYDKSQMKELRKSIVRSLERAGDQVIMTFTTEDPDALSYLQAKAERMLQCTGKDVIMNDDGMVVTMDAERYDKMMEWKEKMSECRENGTCKELWGKKKEFFGGTR